VTGRNHPAVSACLGKAYSHATRGRKDLAAQHICQAIADNPELRAMLEAKRVEYGGLIADKDRLCHIERTIHPILTAALSQQ
jgi:hypothetical protein